MFDFRITRDDSFERTVAALYAAGSGGLRRELESEIRKEGAPTVRAVRAAVRAVRITAVPPAKGHKSSGGRSGPGLRATIARAVRVATRNTRGIGVRIEIAMGRMPPGMRSLPAYVDGRGRWRHPVFGNTKVWVGQRGQPYFVPTILARTPQFRAGVQRAMNTVARRIT